MEPTTRNTKLQTQIENIGILTKRKIKANRSLSIPERDFIRKFATELSLRLPAGTTLYYHPNDPMNPVNECDRDNILQYIDDQVHITASASPMPKNSAPHAIPLRPLRSNPTTPRAYPTSTKSEPKLTAGQIYSIILAGIIFLSILIIISGYSVR